MTVSLRWLPGMSSRRVSARRRPVPRLSDSPVTGHVPPATLQRDADGRYCVTERLQPSRTDGGGGAIGGALGKSPGERGGTSAQPTDATPLSRRAVTNTPSGSGVNKGENTTPQHAPVSSTSRQTDSASSGVRSLTLALSDHGSSPEIGGHRSASDTPPGRPPGTSGPAPARSGAPSGAPGAFDSDEDDIFESDLRGRISDVITLLRGDTDLSAEDGGADGGGRVPNGTAGSSGAGGASGDAEDGAEPLRPKRVLDFELVADAVSAAEDRGVARAPPLPAGAPPCRLPPAHVTADTSVAARARHVVGRRPGERVLSELAELASSPGSPLVRQKARSRVRATARSVTPQGRAAGGPARGEVTPVSARRRGETAQPGEGRAPLAERELNGQAPGPPEPWKSPTGPRKATQSVVSPVVPIRHYPEDANDEVRGGDPEVAVGSPRARLSPCTLTDRENQTPRTRTSPRLAAGGRQSHLPAAATGCSSPAAGGRQSHLPAAAAGCSSPAAAREEEDEIASTQPASKLVLDEVVAYVDVRSGADNRSEPIRTQLRALGALVVERFTKNVTHVIFKDGSKATYDRARRDRLRLVSVLWVDACRRQRERVDENRYPPATAERYESPLFPARLRKLRSMQPRDFDEEMAAADRRFERRRRQQGRQPPPGQTRPGKRPAMTSPKRWGRRTVEELLTPRGRQRSGQVTADTGSSEDELPLNVRLFNRFMSPTGAWSTGGAVRSAGSPTAKNKKAEHKNKKKEEHKSKKKEEHKNKKKEQHKNKKKEGHKKKKMKKEHMIEEERVFKKEHKNQEEHVYKKKEHKNQEEHVYKKKEHKIQEHVYKKKEHKNQEEHVYKKKKHKIQEHVYKKKEHKIQEHVYKKKEHKNQEGHEYKKKEHTNKEEKHKIKKVNEGEQAGMSLELSSTGTPHRLS
ncbi:Microcephalin [Amphibalanus amphitrite]|uniref:Microcephalin n=1 Tax=Amphibalanus amphitrite TaxID=1232801 RepID=A0A6A4W779_AMPAM|nr:Microcephalin [Amphibalanus amphitrite]